MKVIMGAFCMQSAAEPLVDIVLFHDLTQLVKQPTRIQSNAQSILDLFLVSDRILRRNPVLCVYDGVSDHRLLSLSIPLRVRKEMKEQRVVPNFTRADDVAVLDLLDISFSGFSDMYESSSCSVEDLWGFFKNLVMKCVSSHVPSKIIRTQSARPWMTREVVRVGRKLKKMRKQLRRNPSSPHVSRFSNMRLQLNETIKKAKSYYFNISLKNFLLSAPAKFWRHLSPRKQQAYKILIEGELVTDESLLASSFNKFFCSVYTNDDGKQPNFAISQDVPKISDLMITEEGVLSLLLKIDIKKSPGIDCIPNTFLVRYAEWCSKYLSLILKKTLSTAELPRDWKRAKVVPIPKAENPSLITSYRPISLLCTCSKMLEHIIFTHLSNFLQQNKLIDCRQHGFRKGMSTVTQLLETIHEFASALDKQSQIDIIFLDFQKAFDRVSHHKLLLKLKPILQNNSLLSWIESYLSSRSQCVSIGGSCSRPAPVRSGIPQGSVLGPIFFLVFINDIVNDIPVKIKLFADDCILYQEVNTPDDQELLNSALDKLHIWCERWQMCINTTKTVSMTISRKKAPLTFQYSINGRCLSSVNRYKYLGLIITSDLRWNEHVTFIEKKAMKKLGYLKRSLRQSTQEIKILAYKTYIRPLLEYACLVWDPYTKKNIDTL